MKKYCPHGTYINEPCTMCAASFENAVLRAQPDYRAMCKELAEAIEKHRLDIWGDGSIGHPYDLELYKAADKYRKMEVAE